MRTRGSHPHHQRSRPKHDTCHIRISLALAPAAGSATTASTLVLLALSALATDEPSCTPMKVAVIGATGGVGAHVARLAVEQGHHVIALARDPSKVAAAAAVKKPIDLANRDVDALASAIDGADIVLVSAQGLEAW